MDCGKVGKLLLSDVEGRLRNPRSLPGGVHLKFLIDMALPVGLVRSGVALPIKQLLVRGQLSSGAH